MTLRIQRHWLLLLLVCALALIGAVSLIRSTAAQGNDTEVYWRAARSLIDHQPIYNSGLNTGMVFKYPPWIATLLLPLGYIPLQAAKWLWGILEVASLAAISVWSLRHLQLNWQTVALGLALQWGTWIIHALDGQIILPLLALTLALWPPQLLSPPASHLSSQQSPDSVLVPAMRLGLIAVLLSMKIFTLLPWIGFALTDLLQAASGSPKKSKQPTSLAPPLVTPPKTRPLLLNSISSPAFISKIKLWVLSTAVACLGVVLLSLPPLLATGETSLPRGLQQLFQTWQSAVDSGGRLLSLEQVRGYLNPGFPGLTARLLGIGPTETHWDVRFALGYSLLGLLLWHHFSKRLFPRLALCGWLALSPLIHPLPWWHLYAFTYPLTLILIKFILFNENQAPSHRRRTQATKGVALLGLVLLHLSTEKVMGDLGLWLKEVGAKSWGTLFCLAALVLFSQAGGAGERKSRDALDELPAVR